jgi:hypothetical protein
VDINLSTAIIANLVLTLLPTIIPKISICRHHGCKLPLRSHKHLLLTLLKGMGSPKSSLSTSTLKLGESV